MSKLHCMIDLETLDSIPTSAILSIGATIFNNEEILHEFYTPVNTESCVNAGLTIGTDTLNWWLGQGESASAVLSEAKNSDVTLEDALTQFTKFFNENKATYVWSHGASFDQPILSHAFNKVGMKEPWKFWNGRCTRTVYDLFWNVKQPEREGVHHNALDDAKHQTKWLLEIFDHG